jgi:ATP-binding cassette subfamily F protein uup
LDLEKTVIDNIYEGSEFITINGQSRHVMSYLQDFLFSPQQARSPVKSLSGGERNRLLLARLFTQPANVLVLDEPTNDLDAETLELLEEQLLNYQGTLLVVSHDRALLNNVVTSTLVFESEGQVNEYVGGYDDYLRQRRAPATKSATAAPSKSTNEPKKTTTRKLSYNEQRELDQLPALIEQLEAELSNLQIKTNDPEFYQQDQKLVQECLAQLESVEQKLTDTYIRWDQLESSK